MAAKRALIVDDSKSARLFLSRILVQHAIEVETVESAEDAIEYLGDHRPDVIFMDHQMGGMDGLQAVRLIKNNPITATIPIMMYTSQEGELYVGQARALGAVGVMPKQIKQADVSKVLYDLHLLPDRRRTDAADARPVTLDTLAEAAVVAERAVPAIQSITETALREQFAELRRGLVASIETQSDRIIADFHAALRDTPLFATTADRPPPRDHGWPWAIATIALVIALASTAMWWREASSHRSLVTRIADVRRDSINSWLAAESPEAKASAAGEVSSIERGSAARKVPGKSNANETVAKPTVIQVPYGENPLGGARLETYRELFHRLIARKFRGMVDIRSFPGRFCLIGNSTDGYSLAPDELAYARCDAVGNPDAAELAQREPLAFANLVGELRSGTKGAASARVFAGDAATTLVPYPEVAGNLTAGEWNRAAAANNRVEIRLR
jgi:CheY-like chemotaxis protein